MRNRHARELPASQDRTLQRISVVLEKWEVVDVVQIENMTPIEPSWAVVIGRVKRVGERVEIVGYLIELIGIRYTPPEASAHAILHA